MVRGAQDLRHLLKGAQGWHKGARGCPAGHTDTAPALTSTCSHCRWGLHGPLGGKSLARRLESKLVTTSHPALASPKAVVGSRELIRRWGGHSRTRPNYKRTRLQEGIGIYTLTMLTKP